MPTSTPSVDTPSTLTIKELHARYLAAFGKSTTSRNRPWLLRRLQAVAPDPVKPNSEVAQPAPTSPPSLKPVTDSATPGPEEAAQPAAQITGLAPGTQLRRPWKGTTLVLTVTGDGFRLKGVTYRSLSAAATAIAGSNRNGHVFFGLKKRGATP